MQKHHVERILKNAQRYVFRLFTTYNFVITCCKLDGVGKDIFTNHEALTLINY